MSNGVWLGQSSIWLGQCYIWLGYRGDDLRVNIKADIKLDYRGDIRKYFKESKVVLRTQEELV